ncbi:hypothetical protein D3C72_2314090 [compost metagenome]
MRYRNLGLHSFIYGPVKLYIQVVLLVGSMPAIMIERNRKCLNDWRSNIRIGMTHVQISSDQCNRERKAFHLRKEYGRRS